LNDTWSKPGGQALPSAKKMTFSVILSEAKKLSLFVLLYLNRREILRFAQNDSVFSFFAASFGRGIGSSRSKNTRACAAKCTLLLALLLIALITVAAPGVWAQQQVSANPETALSDALSAACRQDSPAFANSLTADNAVAFRALSGAQRTAMMKRFVLLEEPGRVLLSTGSKGQKIVRCESPSYTTEMRIGETRVRENLAFVPIEIPITAEEPRSITFGLVRESGNWKLLSVGLMMLYVPSMAKQWEQADLAAGEDAAIADLRALATALDTYRRAYGELPATLGALGPAPPNGVSPEAASLVDADLATGSKDGYTIRYTIIPGPGGRPEDDAIKAETFSLASTPKEYGKLGRRSFFLDSSGVLRGADKHGSVATSSDPRIGPS
jgi:type II secretory pathway pseudopilin PulG